MYLYKAFCTHVYDGDTITVDIELGFYTWTQQRIRFYGIDTPEIKGKEKAIGQISKQYVVDRIDQKEILIRTIKDKKGKYGRYLGLIFYWNSELDNYVNLNEELVRENLAHQLPNIKLDYDLQIDII